MDLKLIGKLARAGFAFAPTDAGMTSSRRTGWADMATSDLPTIKAWLASGDSLVSAATHGHQYIVDIDDPVAAHQFGFKMEWLDGLFLVDSPSGGIHAYGLHDAISDALPGAYINVRAEKNNKKSPLIVELKLHHASTAAPSVKRFGVKGKKDGIYQPRAPFTTVRTGIHPDMLSWIQEHADDRNTTTMVGRFKGFHPDFDLDHMLENEGCSEVKQGMIGDALHVEVEECPHCGRACVASTLAAATTKFIFGGTGVGFKCHACGIDTFDEHADLMRSKDADYTPWTEYTDGYIYKLDDPAELAKVFKVEDVTNEPEEEPESEELEETTPDDGMVLLASETNDDWERQVYVKPMSAFEDEEMTWLWPGKIPAGMTTIISGKADCGKSLCLIDWIARITTGRDWPDGEKNTLGPRKVIYANSEDDPAKTIRPRLRAAGADLNNVLILNIKMVQEGKKRGEHLNVSSHAATLVKTFKQNPDVAAIILDPLTSYIGDVSLNKDEQARPMMDKLALLGQKTGVAVVALVHNNKRSDVGALEKVMGATSVTGSARVTWTFAKDPEEKGLYRMGIAKGNVLKKKNGLEYKIVDATVEVKGKPTTHPKIEWGKETDADAEDMLNAERQKARDGGEDTKMTLAVAVLRDTLPCLAEDLFRKAEAEGLNERLIYRAKDKLGVQGVPKGRKKWWYIPGEAGDPAIVRDKSEAEIPYESIM